MMHAKVIPLRPRRRFIAVCGKGGVGKSTIAVNLALSYAKLGHRTLAVDGDFGMADLNLLLGLAPEKSLLDVVVGSAQVADVLIERHGVHLLPGANGCFRLANPDRFTRRRIAEALDEVRSTFDTLILDTAAGIEAHAMSVTASAEDVLVVATPEPLSLANAYAGIKVLTQNYGVERFFLLPNQIRSDDQGEELTRQLASLVDHFLGIEMVILPSIPHDALMNGAATSGIPLVIGRPDAPFSRAIARVARALTEELP